MTKQIRVLQTKGIDLFVRILRHFPRTLLQLTTENHIRNLTSCFYNIITFVDDLLVFVVYKYDYAG